VADRLQPMGAVACVVAHLGPGQHMLNVSGVGHDVVEVWIAGLAAGFLAVSARGHGGCVYVPVVTEDPAAVATLVYWEAVKWSNR
jgi:hypothetical protein